MYERIKIIIKTALGILKGEVVVIYDKDPEGCDTFVGSSISRERFRVLIMNHLYKIKGGKKVWEG